MKTMQRNYKVINFPPLTEEQKSMLDNLSKKTDLDIDTSDISEAVGNGGFYYVNSLKIPKTDIHTKIDNDILEVLKKGGRGYQTRINNVLRWAIMNGCPLIKG